MTHAYRSDNHGEACLKDTVDHQAQDDATPVEAQHSIGIVKNLLDLVHLPHHSLWLQRVRLMGSILQTLSHIGGGALTLCAPFCLKTNVQGEAWSQLIETLSDVPSCPSFSAIEEEECCSI